MTSAFVDWKSATFVISRNTDIPTLRFNTYFLILINFLKSLKVVLINIVAILMMSEKLATIDLLKTRSF